MTWCAIAWTCAALLATTSPAAPSSSARVYPIPPVPLRELVEKADVIVAVKVRALEMALPAHEVGYELVALDVEQTLKGDPGLAMIRYCNNTMTLCPEPARYQPLTRALAFLMRTKDGANEWAPDGFETLALSYGSKTLEEAVLAVYVERIKAQLAILAMKEGPERMAAQVEWLVRCAEEPATRWEGAFDLSIDGGPDRSNSFTHAPSLTRKNPFAEALTSDQRARLLAVLLLSTHDGPGEQNLSNLFLLGDDRDATLLAPFVARLRATLDRDLKDPSIRFAKVSSWILARDDRSEVIDLSQEIAANQRELRPAREGDRAKLERLLEERRRLVRELLALFPP